MKAANRVIFNTGVLYAKLLITLLASLFTTRFVLDALGETNYGIYTLVAGVIGMLGFLKASMTGAAMRFMGHRLGTGDKEKVRSTFNNVLFIHILVGILLVIVIEVAGLLLIEKVLEIPAEKVFDAKVIFHFMVLTLFFTIIEVPYDAVLNAHENLLAISIIDIAGVILKLGIAIYLTYVNTNHLILYGGLMFAVQFLMRLTKQVYGTRKYEECNIQIKKYVNKYEISLLLSFTGWNIFGSLSSMTVKQVRSVLLNMFFGININAADGISKKAGDQINQVSVSLTRAINPQMLKSEGVGDRKRMLRITGMSTKFSLFLFSLFLIPLMFETSYLLDIWLTKVPEYAVIFIKLNLIAMFLEKSSFELTNAIKAVGNIKKFTIIESLLRILNVPIIYFVFKLGYPPQTIFIIYIFISAVIFIERLILGKQIANLNISYFLKNSILKVLVPIVFSLSIAWLINFNVQEGFVRFILTTILSMAVLALIFRYTGMDKREIEIVKGLIYSFKNRMKLKNK